jgi:hypothetical protein
VGSLLVVLSVVSGLLVGSGNASKVFDLGDGTAWVSDNTPGGSGVAGVSVGSAGSDWRSVGGGTVRRVVAGADGSVWAQLELDDGSFVWRKVGKDGKPTDVGSPGAEKDQVVVTGGGKAWLVDAKRSSVTSLSGERAEKRIQPQVRGGIVPVAGVDGDGRLVVVTVSSVVVFDEIGGKIKELGRFDAPDGLTSVVVVGDKVVLVSAGTGSATVVDGAKASKRLDLGASGKQVLVPDRSSGSVLWVLDPVSRRVVGTHVDGRRIGEIPLPDGGGWGAPVVVGDVVMVRAQIGGRLSLWRGVVGSRFQPVDLTGVGDIGSCDGGCPEVFESGGRLWVNRSTAPDVAVVDAAGNVRVVPKARPNATGQGDAAGGAAAQQRRGAQVKEAALERAEVPAVPYRRPPQGVPAGAGEVPGANTKNPTAGRAGDPTTGRPIGANPNAETPADGSAPDPNGPGATPSGQDPGGSAPCAAAPAVVGDHSAPPAAPAAVTATGSTSGRTGSIRVSWAIAGTGPVVCGFLVQLVGGVEPVSRVVGAAETSVTVEGLPGGEFTVSVRASNNAGMGEPAFGQAVVKVDVPVSIEPGPQSLRSGRCAVDWFHLDFTPGWFGGRSAQGFRPLNGNCDQITLRFRIDVFGPTVTCSAVPDGSGYRMSGYCGNYLHETCPYSYMIPSPDPEGWPSEGGCPGPWIPVGAQVFNWTDFSEAGWGLNPGDICLTVEAGGADPTVRRYSYGGEIEMVPDSFGILPLDPCRDFDRWDLNHDGYVGCLDLGVVVAQVGSWVIDPGDVDGDGVVTGTDYDIVAARIPLPSSDGTACPVRPA